MKDSNKQIEVVNRLSEIFLDDYDSPIDRKLKSGDELKVRWEGIKAITEGVSLEERWVLELFLLLEGMAKDQLDAHILLSQTIEPDVLSGYVDGALVEGAKKAQAYGVHMSASNAGKGNKKEGDYEIMLFYYKEWRKNTGLYGNQERYIEAMYDKTKIGRSTILRNLKLIKELVS